VLIAGLESLLRRGQSAIAIYMQHEDNTGALQIRRDSRSSRRALCHGRWKQSVLLFALSRFLWMYDMRLARLMVVL